MRDWATRLDVPERNFEFFCVGIWVTFDLLDALRDGGFMTQQEVNEFGPEAVNIVAKATGRSLEERNGWNGSISYGRENCGRTGSNNDSG
jgi:hypothetical protein